MHNKLPKYLTYIDKYDENISNINIPNIGIVYRNYFKKTNLKEILKIKLKCKEKGFKFYISNNLKLSLKINADGIYLPSFNTKMFLKNKTFKKDFLIIGSAHNYREIFKKKKQGCNLIVLSPLFKSKKNNKALGINNFNKLTQNFNIKFLALGGINNNNIKKLKMLNIEGFAGISYFQKKNRPKIN